MRTNIKEYPTTSMGEQPKKCVAFWTDSFFEKDGFGDGDMLYDLLARHNFRQRTDDERFWYLGRATLIEIIRERVISAIKNEIECRILWSNHNPFRIWKVDGIDLAEYQKIHQRNPTLTPAYVAVNEADILAMAEKLLVEFNELSLEKVQDRRNEFFTNYEDWDGREAWRPYL